MEKVKNIRGAGRKKILTKARTVSKSVTLSKEEWEYLQSLDNNKSMNLVAQKIIRAYIKNNKNK